MLELNKNCSSKFIDKTCGDLSVKFHAYTIYILFFSASYYYGYFGSIFSFIVLFIIMWYLLSGRGERLDIGYVVFLYNLGTAVLI
jgi:hypothetical protein